MAGREALKRPEVVIALAVALTALVWLESFLPPWAPYFLLYAALAIAIPAWTRSYRFGGLREAFAERWKWVLACLALAIAVDLALSLAYAVALGALGLAGDPYYDLGAALEALAGAAAVRLGITSEQAVLIYALYVLIWAPVGEELFYRGYMYGELEDRLGLVAAVGISTFFFGIRHATHFALLSPFPLVAALWWAFHAFCFGLVMVYAYRRVGSLYAPMLAHFVANLVGVLLSL